MSKIKNKEEIELGDSLIKEINDFYTNTYKVKLIEKLRDNLLQEVHKEITTLYEPPHKTPFSEKVIYNKSLEIFDKVVTEVFDKEICEED